MTIIDCGSDQPSQIGEGRCHHTSYRVFSDALASLELMIVSHTHNDFFLEGGVRRVGSPGTRTFLREKNLLANT